MGDNSNLILCYNRGCAVKFDKVNNSEDACVYHPGDPFFHDAYKGWSCCKKKCTDFTEFLNIKGCTKGYHNGKKPKEPEKYVPDNDNKVIEYHVPKPVSLPRPPIDSELIDIKLTISSTLIQQMATSTSNTNGNETNSIPTGLMCRNKGCKEVYDENSTENLSCHFHPGQPIFHEGMKYWSCCNKKTADFNLFLEQVGCTQGDHLWTPQDKVPANANCRLDWHQTGPWVVISIYAKKYDPKTSFVKLSPVCLSVKLNFPSDNSVFKKNMELYGIVDVNTSCASMFPTKVEIKLKKAEAISWGVLQIYREHTFFNNSDNPLNSGTNDKHENSNGTVESVDLGDL